MEVSAKLAHHVCAPRVARQVGQLVRIGFKVVEFINVGAVEDVLVRLGADDAQLEALMWYLIEEDGSLRVEEDHHVLGVFSTETWLRLIAEPGFTTGKVP